MADENHPLASGPADGHHTVWQRGSVFRMKTTLIVTALAVGSFYIIGLCLLTLLQRRYVFVPARDRPDLSACPIASAREMAVHTSDGLELLAWYVSPDDDTKPVILYLHGNGHHIGYRAPRLAYLNRLGWGALLLEYRGFGGNPGAPTETGLIQGARAAYETLRRLGIPSQRIILWGESLGTGVAVRLATDVEVGAVMLESPYTSILAIGQKQFPFVPVAWLLKDRFDLIGRIPSVHAPVLIMVGGQDRVVPPAMSQAVFAAANGPKVMWLAPEAGHNDLAAAGAFDAVEAFVQKYYGFTP